MLLITQILIRLLLLNANLINLDQLLIPS